MDRKLVKQRIQTYSIEDLKKWRKHAVKCLNYFTKYRDDFEIEECQFVIDHIDERLDKMK